ncbi:DUF58 domain-containing protein [Roseiconus nitratireducens]|uniref:DUF58 domain-containing protein n=1 Tax=Roseiconus nitratireducens TaxID=2605748 RepID=A0A5M6DP09_9BACT|nr:DUF58 domain-containing protein [Roseiconus nitratireducens]KAA5547175.1 DUF58 domain-containing protein [Roseiconus nitratireducens]
MVPRLLRPRYRYRLTRLGFHFLFVALFAIIGGSLRGFNLLLILAGLMISVVIVQWRQGRHDIRHTQMRRLPVAGAFANEPVLIHYEVRNTSRFFPLWLIRIQDSLQRRFPAGEREAAGGTERIERAPLVASVGLVPPGGITTTSVRCQFHQRGCYQLGPTYASTTFPFSLMQCDRMNRSTAEWLYVYPNLIPLRRGWQVLLPPRRGGEGNRSTGGTNHDGEFFGLRPWQSGDHIKHVHWRTTARIGVPAVRQFEQRNRHRVCLLVDGLVSTRSARDMRSFETVLSLAATMIMELATRTRSVGLLVADACEEPAFLQASGSDLTGLLRRLAIARPCLSRLPAGRRGASPSEDLDRLTDVVTEHANELRRFDIVAISNRPISAITRAPSVAVDASQTAAPAERQHRAAESRAMAKRAGGIWHYFDQSGRLSWLDVESPRVRRYLADEPAGPMKRRWSSTEASHVIG